MEQQRNSDKMTDSDFKVLVYGHQGWIAGKFIDAIKKNKPKWTIYKAKSRADDTEAVRKELAEIEPDTVLCSIGRVHGEGYQTIDYLEQPGKLKENIRDNLYAPINLAMLCKESEIHMTYIGTGCIYNYDDKDHPVNGVVGFKENDIPNFTGSSYSTVKGYVNRFMNDLMREFVLHLRIRMPIASDQSSRNFIKKITKYEKICSIPNSMTVLDDMIPVALDLMEQNWVGALNFTNPGVISHNDILDMYKQIVDPSFTWKNFTLEEQRLVLLSERSNNYLDTSLLTQIYPRVLNIREAVKQCLIQMKKNLDDTNNNTIVSTNQRSMM